MVFTNNMKYFPKYSHHILLYYYDIFPSFYLQRGNEYVFDKFLSLAFNLFLLHDCVGLQYIKIGYFALFYNFYY